MVNALSFQLARQLSLFFLFFLFQNATDFWNVVGPCDIITVRSVVAHDPNRRVLGRPDNKVSEKDNRHL